MSYDLNTHLGRENAGGYGQQNQNARDAQLSSAQAAERERFQPHLASSPNDRPLHDSGCTDVSSSRDYSNSVLVDDAPRKGQSSQNSEGLLDLLIWLPLALSESLNRSGSGIFPASCRGLSRVFWTVHLLLKATVQIFAWVIAIGVVLFLVGFGFVVLAGFLGGLRELLGW